MINLVMTSFCTELSVVLCVGHSRWRGGCAEWHDRHAARWIIPGQALWHWTYHGYDTECYAYFVDLSLLSVAI